MNTPSVVKIPNAGKREEWPDLEQIGVSEGKKFHSEVVPVQAAGAEFWNIRLTYHVSAESKEEAVSKALRKYSRQEKMRGEIEACKLLAADMFEIAIVGKQARRLRYRKGVTVGYVGGDLLPYNPSLWKENLGKWTKIATRYEN